MFPTGFFHAYIPPIRENLPILTPRRFTHSISSPHKDSLISFSGGSYNPNNREEVYRERLRRTRERNGRGHLNSSTSAKIQKKTSFWSLPKLPRLSELYDEIKSQEARNQAGKEGVQGELF